MARLNAANNAEATLIQAVGETDTTITVDDASVFPDVPFRLSINDEIVEVTEVAGNELTVERGKEGTAPAEHNAGDKAENRFTAGMHNELATAEEVGAVEQTVVAHLAESTQRFNSLHRQNTAQDRELAYLKLKQEAADRIENGTTFADDFKGNRFGMAFNEAESQNVTIRNGAMIMAESTQETITVEDATVVNSAYNTSGNSGRKLIRLSNGWLVAAVVSNDAPRLRFYVDRRDGNGFVLLGTSIVLNVISKSVSLASKDTVLFCSSSNGTSSFSIESFDALEGNGSPNNTYESYFKKDLDANQSSVDSGSIFFDDNTNTLHAAWASKNSTYPNSFNIRYAKGTISEIDGSVTWGSVEQVTTANNSAITGFQNPSTLIFGNTPFIVSQGIFSSGGSNIIHLLRRDSLGPSTSLMNTGWTLQDIYNGGAHAQSSPSAIFVPPEINGLPQGRIWVAWHGTDSSYSSARNIRVSYSDDGGATWSVANRITNFNGASYMDSLYPSVTVNKRNKVFITYYAMRSGQYGNFANVYMMTFDGEWSDEVNITKSSTNTKFNQSTLLDANLDFDLPLFIYMESNSKVGFYGSWTEGTETPTTTGTAVYDLPSTDYVGAFVKKEGNVNIDAYINDTLMDSDLENDEYMFTKDLPNEAPIKLRLELSRADTTGGKGDKITRILGGIA